MPSNKPGYQKEYFKRWYKKNREKHIAICSARRAIQAATNQQKVAEYLSTHPCVDCGETDILVLQFDHVRGKKKTEVSKLMQSGYPWRVVLEEIEKCQVRCANDHVRKTMRAQKSYRVQWVAGVRGNIPPF